MKVTLHHLECLIYEAVQHFWERQISVKRENEIYYVNDPTFVVEMSGRQKKECEMKIKIEKTKVIKIGKFEVDH